MSFAKVFEIFKAIYAEAPTLAPLLLQVLSVIQRVVAAASTAGTLKLMAHGPLSAEHLELGEELHKLGFGRSNGFDGHRIAQLMQFAMAHPTIFLGVMKMLGVPQPIIDLISSFVNEPAPVAAAGDLNLS